MRGLLRDIPRLVAALLGIGAAAGALAVAHGSGRFTTYAGSSSVNAALTLGAGLGLVAAGLVVTAGRGPSQTGDAALLAGLMWFAPVAVAWREGPELVRSGAALVAPLTFPLLVHLVVAYPSKRLGSRAARALVGATYAEALTAGVLLALFREPYLDRSCWSNCSVNTFLVVSLPDLARRVELADRWAVAAFAAALIALCAERLARASPVGRRRQVAFTAPAIILGAATIARSSALQHSIVENPSDKTLQAIFAVGAGSVILVAAGIVAGVARERTERRAVGRVAANLDAAPTPGTLQAALANALGDPDLRIGYRLPGRERYVDAEGRPLPEATERQPTTSLVRNGRTIAIVSHAGGGNDLETHLGPSLLLGLENERLQAQVLAQLEELRASRARIVETADRERRRLERDLHDGAQQRLLALLYDLRVARSAPGANVARLDRAVAQAHVALEELRDLAHGIHPAILGEAGLGAALATFADTAPLRIAVVDAEPRRFPSAVESAAYVTVVDCVEDAVQRGAARVEVDVTTRNGHLSVTVTDDGASRGSTSTELADRIGALGGELVYGEHHLQVEIPCV